MAARPEDASTLSSERVSLPNSYTLDPRFTREAGTTTIPGALLAISITARALTAGTIRRPSVTWRSHPAAANAASA